MSFASDNCAFCHQTKTPIRMLFEYFDSLYPKGMCEISKRYNIDVYMIISSPTSLQLHYSPKKKPEHFTLILEISILPSF